MRRANKTDFSAWVERTIHLPLGLSANPGQITLPIYLHEIAAVMDDSATPIPAFESLIRGL